MRIFEETQRFDQWWLYLIILLAQGTILLGMYQATLGFQDWSDPWGLLGGTITIALLSLLLLVRLKTRIDNSGISAKFGEKFFRRKFKWSEIKDCYVRKYSPLTEYGGWGIRGVGRSKAYSTSGNYGIQIVTTTGTRFLIGTQKPEIAKETLKYYRVNLNLQKI